jgi:hypothetical protein
MGARILGARAKNSKITILPKTTTRLPLIMALPTRNQPFRTPSPEPLANNEATTRRKCKLFDALTRYGSTKSLRSISRECKIEATTGRTWRDQWKNMGSEAKRRTRPRSSILGANSKVTKSMCKMQY